MTPLKTLIAAAGVVLGLIAVCEPAYADGRRGFRHNPSVHVSVGHWGRWGPGWGRWGPGWGWGASWADGVQVGAQVGVGVQLGWGP